MRTALLLVVLAGVVSGCAHSAAGSIAGPGMNAKREANLLAAAAKDLGCPQESLTTAFVESIEKNAHIYRVSGCEKTYDSILFCAAGVCSWNETPEKRASFDLQCPREQLKRTYLGDGTFGMSGCDRTITYLFVNGRLVANVTGSQVPSPPPAR